ncbi:phosphoserine phosphatase SerB [Nesterenkonia flava]|uniref:phosphoserine phosphatase n=1 Tax=Nesterenkonia flava TaxID=469799 RepID=A0ABU1FPY4_9MICC|nr:phosphoserine phosphatase SerB [Nesterenkonia flava]MDR5710699.1 phosphoserine phosphatase SerB [Nesterenkonia flava]
MTSSLSRTADSAGRPGTSADLPAGSVAMIAAETLDAGLLRSLAAEFARRGTIHATDTAEFTAGSGTARHQVKAVRWSLSMEDSDDDFGTQLIGSLLEDVAHQLSADGQIVTTTVVPARHRPVGDSGERLMLIMDVDSTLIDQEVIDLLAAHAGRAQEVAEVTERAMRGELDFAQSLHARVAALKDLPESVLEEVYHQVTPTAGAEELVAEFRRRDWPVYAVSGGFLQILEPLAEVLQLTGYHANDLQLHEGRLAGTVAGAVVDRTAKRERLLSWAQENGVSPQSVVAIGDGANDLDMVTAAGLGVAFCPKPALAEQADLVISHRNLLLVPYALGISR